MMITKNREDTKNKKVEKKSTDSGKKLLIASYREQYSENSLKKIRKLIREIRPKKIVILKLIEEKLPSDSVDAGVGVKEKEEIIESIREEKMERVDRFTGNLLEIINDFDIPIDVRFRKSSNLANEIIKGFNEMDADFLIIHTPKKGPLGKVIDESISEKVKKILKAKKVALLE